MTRRMYRPVPFLCSVLLFLSVATRAQDAAVTALTSLTDPAKLATLQSDRAANPRLLKCVYWLNDYKSRGNDPSVAIRED
jgi:hypothetical protein